MAIMFNGLTYGTGPDVPRQLRDGWDFVPVPLSGDFRADFQDLVRTFGDFRRPDGSPAVLLMPCLFGFELAADPFYPVRPPRAFPAFTDFTDARGVRYMSGRRASALRRRPLFDDFSRTYQEAFLTHVVDGLLVDFRDGGALAAHRDVIHSVDLCGEPEAFAAAPPDDPGHVSRDDTIALLNDGLGRIASHGLCGTIGFRTMAAYQGREWAGVHPHRHQFHYYDGETLPYVHGDDVAIIGEAAMTATSPFDPNVVAALGGDRSPATSPPVPLGLRLEWFERLHYDEVFLWSAGRSRPDERHSWTDVEADQIRGFVRENARPHRRIVEAAAALAHLPAR
jgi:hypothetical protein